MLQHWGDLTLMASRVTCCATFQALRFVAQIDAALCLDVCLRITCLRFPCPWRVLHQLTGTTPLMSNPASQKKDSMVDAAYAQIRRRILDVNWPPGFQVLEMDVATELKMSRTPVREAMIRLQREGLLEVIPRHGMRVLPVSPGDMRELYQVLTALECMAAELLALRKPSRKELIPLIAATTSMEEALKADDLDAWAVADERFHALLVDLSGNRQLKETVLNYWDRAHRARMFTLRLRPKPLNSTKEHMRMVECFLTGDDKGAVEITRYHRERANRELVTIFERYKLAQM